MAHNPLERDPARDRRIRQRAYHLWEADGKPHGRDDEYWERASELVGMEESAGSGQLPNPSTQPGADPSRTQPIEEAFLQDNLGEFPDRLADQGEVMSSPARRQAARQPDTSPAPGAAGDAADKKQAAGTQADGKPGGKAGADKAAAKTAVAKTGKTPK